MAARVVLKQSFHPGDKVFVLVPATVKHVTVKDGGSLYGVEICDSVLLTDGKFADHQLFTTKPGRALFTTSRLMQLREAKDDVFKNKAAETIQAHWRGFQDRLAVKKRKLVEDLNRLESEGDALSYADKEKRVVEGWVKAQTADGKVGGKAQVAAPPIQPAPQAMVDEMKRAPIPAPAVAAGHPVILPPLTPTGAAAAPTPAPTPAPAAAGAELTTAELFPHTKIKWAGAMEFVKDSDEFTEAVAALSARKPVAADGPLVSVNVMGARVAQRREPVLTPLETATLTLNSPSARSSADDITFEFIGACLDLVRKGEILPKFVIESVLKRAIKHFNTKPNLLRVTVPTRLTVVGDLHGQIEDLLHLFDVNGLPSERNGYLFNGDWVDRGQNACEIVTIITSFAMLYPDSVFLLRGNHECRLICSSRQTFGIPFHTEVTQLKPYGDGLFEKFITFFKTIPLCAVINNEVFVTHGGLPPEPIKLDDINRINRFVDDPPESPANNLMECLLWSDPCESKDPRLGGKPWLSHPNRGVGIIFSHSVTEKFLVTNNLGLLLRSHEVRQPGFSAQHGERCVTVFSASNYGGQHNKGAVFIFDKDMKAVRRIQWLLASDDVKAMKSSTKTFRLRHQIAKSTKDVLGMIMSRICDRSLLLMDYWGKLEKLNGGVMTITRKQWLEGLTKVCELSGLQTPLESFTDQLGLPKLGVDGTLAGPIDYQDFLLRYRPVNLVVFAAEKILHNTTPAPPRGEMARHAAAAAVGVPAERSRRDLMHMLAKYNIELKALFSYFDKDGSGYITTEEFQEAALGLRTLLKRDVTDGEINRLAKLLDKNKDGRVSYQEFLNAFEYPGVIRK